MTRSMLIRDGETIFDNGDPARPEYDPTTANEQTLSTRAEQAIDGLKSIANSSGTLTTAQLSNAVRLLARVALAVVRLQLRRLDSVD